MANTLIDAVGDICTDASITLDSTYANSSVKINWNQQSQIDRVSMIKEFLQYGDHVGFIDVNDSKLYLVDIITGITPALNLSTSEDSFEIMQTTGQLVGKFVRRFIADFNIKEFDSGGINGKPGLKDVPITLASPATKYTGGEEQVIKLMSQPTNLSGGEIVYSYTDISTVLARKKTLHESTNVDILYNGLLNIKRGQRVSYSNTWEDDREVLKGSGEFTVLSISYDTKNLTTRLNGIGTFTEA